MTQYAENDKKYAEQYAKYDHKNVEIYSICNWYIVLHIILLTTTFHFAYFAYSTYGNMPKMYTIDPCIFF